MKKTVLMIVAAAAVCAAVPASAQTVVIRDGVHRGGPGFHHRGPVFRSRAEYRRPFIRRPYVRRGGPAIVIRP